MKYTSSKRWKRIVSSGVVLSILLSFVIGIASDNTPKHSQQVLGDSVTNNAYERKILGESVLGKSQEFPISLGDSPAKIMQRSQWASAQNAVKLKMLLEQGVSFIQLTDDIFLDEFLGTLSLFNESTVIDGNHQYSIIQSGVPSGTDKNPIFSPTEPSQSITFQNMGIRSGNAYGIVSDYKTGASNVMVTFDTVDYKGPVLVSSAYAGTVHIKDSTVEILQRTEELENRGFYMASAQGLGEAAHYMLSGSVTLVRTTEDMAEPAPMFRFTHDNNGPMSLIVLPDSNVSVDNTSSYLLDVKEGGAGSRTNTEIAVLDNGRFIVSSPKGWDDGEGTNPAVAWFEVSPHATFILSAMEIGASPFSISQMLDIGEQSIVVVDNKHPLQQPGVSVVGEVALTNPTLFFIKGSNQIASTQAVAMSAPVINTWEGKTTDISITAVDSQPLIAMANGQTTPLVSEADGVIAYFNTTETAGVLLADGAEVQLDRIIESDSKYITGRVSQFSVADGVIIEYPSRNQGEIIKQRETLSPRADTNFPGAFQFTLEQPLQKEKEVPVQLFHWEAIDSLPEGGSLDVSGINLWSTHEYTIFEPIELSIALTGGFEREGVYYNPVNMTTKAVTGNDILSSKYSIEIINKELIPPDLINNSTEDGFVLVGGMATGNNSRVNLETLASYLGFPRGTYGLAYYVNGQRKGGPDFEQSAFEIITWINNNPIITPVKSSDNPEGAMILPVFDDGISKKEDYAWKIFSTAENGEMREQASGIGLEIPASIFAALDIQQNDLTPYTIQVQEKYAEGFFSDIVTEEVRLKLPNPKIALDLQENPTLLSITPDTMFTGRDTSLYWEIIQKDQQIPIATGTEKTISETVLDTLPSGDYTITAYETFQPYRAGESKGTGTATASFTIRALTGAAEISLIGKEMWEPHGDLVATVRLENAAEQVYYKTLRVRGGTTKISDLESNVGTTKGLLENLPVGPYTATIQIPKRYKVEGDLQQPVVVTGEELAEVQFCLTEAQYQYLSATDTGSISFIMSDGS